ncbi:hypothetical protein EZ313_17915 [Ramlibacter henchirensis]|uniref:Uncharacterized protein n=1 Tax=Ramlibacter henchirensis TaxID=204072 RepID=A0A4Z0BYS1_9BURK|nr:hypothetical protein [Ramlibacter henchirensis]TFZ03089.1 hypothetical protein EZ313_17915 [Ramlibacter henchirensis]
MDKLHPIFDKWLAAQAAAEQAHFALSRAHLQELRGGPPVPQDLLDAARALRLRADFLLPEALAEMERLAREVREQRAEP